MNVNRALLLSLLALAACGGDKSKDEEEEKTAQVSPDQYKKKQAAFADSVLNATSSAKAVVEKMGKGYEVGSVRMRDTIMVLAGEKSQCFQNGRKADPYLAGTVSFFVHMNITGSDVISVQESQWTAPPAGNIVDACLNEVSRAWKLDGTFGKPNAYIVQVQFK